MITLKCLVYALLVAASSSQYAYEDECSIPLLDRARLTATSSLPERGPQNARLNGDSTWSPELSSYDQHLTVELGDRYEIRSIATRGRAHTNEYVTEYIVQYSDDGQAWASYESQDGVDEVLNFKDAA